MSKDALILWKEVYKSMSSNENGIVDALTSRGEAQILRIATIYAIADKSEFIELDNLKAAIAVWNFCKDSVAYIWSDGLLGKLDKKVLKTITDHPQGLTKSEMHKAFNNNYRASELDNSVQVLIKMNKIRSTESRSNGAVKSSTRYFISEATNFTN